MKLLKTKYDFDKKKEFKGEIVDEKKAHKEFSKGKNVVMIIHKGSLEYAYLVDNESDFNAFRYIVATYIIAAKSQKFS